MGAMQEVVKELHARKALLRELRVEELPRENQELLQTLEEWLLSKDLTKEIVVQSSDDLDSDDDPNDNGLSVSSSA